MKSSVLTEFPSVSSHESENLLLHHLHSFSSNDLESLMSDYNDQSVLVTTDQTYKGVDEIKNFFVDLMEHFPPERSNFKLDKLVALDEVVFITWHATTPSLEVSLGTDTFVVKGGKIYRQTFAGQMRFLN